MSNINNFKYHVIQSKIITSLILTWNFPSLARKNVSNDPFSINSVIIIVGWAFVTTPWRNITLGCSNWPIIEASVRKSIRALSELPGFRVLIATSMSAEEFDLSGKLNRPLQTSPNSPPPIIASIVIYRESISLANCRTAMWGSSYVCGSTY